MKQLLERVAHNYDHLEEVDGKIRISRFTEKQLAYYRSKDQATYQRALCSTGICLDMITDAPYIRLVYDAQRAMPHFEYNAIDLYIDGVLVSSTPGGEGENLTWTYRFEKPGKRRVTVYLPFGPIFRFSQIDLGGADAERVEPEKRFLFLGDSITMGNMTCMASTLYTSQLGRLFGAEALNQGVGGYVYDSETLDEAMTYRPDMIFTAYGTNDFGRLDGDEAAFEQIVRAYYQRLTACWPQAKICAITPLWRADRNETVAQSWRGVIEKVCAEFPDIRILPGDRLLAHLPAFFSDGKLHPNDLGNTMLAMEIAHRLGC